MKLLTVLGAVVVVCVVVVLNATLLLTVLLGLPSSWMAYAATTAATTTRTPASNHVLRFDLGKRMWARRVPISEDALVQIGTYDQLHARANGTAAIADIAPLVAAFAGDVYLVGGAVRDLIIGRQFIDVDLAVDGDPSKLAAEIGDAEPAETKFGTSSVQRDGYRYDLARTRRESYPNPGALPEVAPAGIDADLGRRDFTVNALALGLSGSRAGELIAADGALDDLESQRLAVLHDAQLSR